MEMDNRDGPVQLMIAVIAVPVALFVACVAVFGLIVLLIVR